MDSCLKHRILRDKMGVAARDRGAFFHNIKTKRYRVCPQITYHRDVTAASSLRQKTINSITVWVGIMGVIRNWLDATRVGSGGSFKLVLFIGVVMPGFSGIAPAHADGYVQSETVWRSNIAPVVDFPEDRTGDACTYFAQTAFSKTSWVSFEGVGKCWVLPPPNSHLLKGTYWATTHPDRNSVEHGEYVMARTATVCPEHSNFTYSGCWCWSDYVPDGKKCIQPLTISLSGLGGEVMPAKTLTAYAKVTKSDGSAKSGAYVDLILTVVPDNGEPIRAEHVGSISPNGGATGADGRLSFVFTAPQAGGTHTISAFCTASGCTNYAEGKITVPECKIPPLSAPPFTDPLAQDFENGNRWRPDLLTAEYQSKLTCVQDAITAAGGTYAPGTSAYRPTEYQQHLFEVIKKDVKLKPTYMLAHPECQALRNKVTGEMKDHGLKYDQDVAEPGMSRHESGTAFDLKRYGLTEAQMLPIYTRCGVTNTAVPSEPWHVQ